VSKKIGIQEHLVFSSPTGLILTESDLYKTVGEIEAEFGSSFDVIDNGMVGSDLNTAKWQLGKAELHVPPFAPQWQDVGPQNANWGQRLQLEIILLTKYIDYLKSEKVNPWFFIKPDPDPKYRGMLWRGYIVISKYNIRYDLVILLSKEYPKMAPRAFIEDSLTELAGSRIYVKNRFPPSSDSSSQINAIDNVTKKSFVMLCHDHITEVEGVWSNNLGITHFFIREVWFWFAAMYNVIISEYERKIFNKETTLVSVKSMILADEIDLDKLMVVLHVHEHIFYDLLWEWVRMFYFKIVEKNLSRR